MIEVSVVHLVRACNGPAPLKQFLDSYREHSAGLEHNLIIVFKGFQHGLPDKEITELLTDFPHQSLIFDDRGFDIGAYFAAAETLTTRYICFINSFSKILGDNWLFKLYQQITAEGVGMVGATGSWESFYTNNLQTTCTGPAYPQDLMFRWWQLRNFKKWFTPFPNPHLRTNGFIISRELMLKIKRRKIANKMDAHRFESGRNGLSNQIRSMGLKLVIVGRDGQGYHENDWILSNTFRLADQENLLIGDNQSRGYDDSSASERHLLTSLSWGTGSV